jgi:hypothetical protein
MAAESVASGSSAITPKHNVSIRPEMPNMAAGITREIPKLNHREAFQACTRGAFFHATTLAAEGQWECIGTY